MKRSLAWISAVTAGLIVAALAFHRDHSAEAVCAPTAAPRDAPSASPSVALATPSATTPAERTPLAPPAEEVDGETDEDAPLAAWSPRVDLDPLDASIVFEIDSTERGEPVADVALALRDAPLWEGGPRGAYQFATSARTDRAGRAALTLPAGHAFEVELRSPENDDVPVWHMVGPFGVGEHSTVNWTIRTRVDRRFLLRAVDQSTGAPIAGAHVAEPRPKGTRGATTHAARVDELFEDAELPPTVQATSDSDGLAVLAIDRWVGSEYAVDAPGYASAFVTATPGHDSIDDAARVELARSARILAHVVDLSGAPPQSIHVIATSSARGPVQGERPAAAPRTRRAEVETTTNELAVLDSLPANVALAIEVERSGVQVLACPAPILLAPGETRVLELAIAGGARVVGHVADLRGAGLGGAEIWIVPDLERATNSLEPTDLAACASRAWTNDDGAFSFEHIAPGRWIVGPAPYRNGDVSSCGVELSIAPSTPSVAVEILAMRGAHIRGRVVEPNGRAACDVVVSAESLGSRARFAARTRSDGSFDVGPLDSNEYRIGARSTRALAASATAIARGGDAGVVLTLRAGASLAVSVVDASGRAVRGATVYAVPDDRREFEEPLGPLALDGDGYSLGPVSFGRYDVVALDARGVAAAHAELEPGSAALLELRLEPAARLRIAWSSIDADVRAELQFGEFARGAVILHRGELVELPVRAGAVSVRWRDGRGALGSRSLELPAGATEQLELGKK